VVAFVLATIWLVIVIAPIYIPRELSLGSVVMR
jgi:hypothetical protein